MRDFMFRDGARTGFVEFMMFVGAYSMRKKLGVAGFDMLVDESAGAMAYMRDKMLDFDKWVAARAG